MKKEVLKNIQACGKIALVIGIVVASTHMVFAGWIDPTKNPSDSTVCAKDTAGNIIDKANCVPLPITTLTPAQMKDGSLGVQTFGASGISVFEQQVFAPATIYGIPDMSGTSSSLQIGDASNTVLAKVQGSVAFGGSIQAVPLADESNPHLCADGNGTIEKCPDTEPTAPPTYPNTVNFNPGIPDVDITVNGIVGYTGPQTFNLSTHQVKGEHDTFSGPITLIVSKPITTPQFNGGSITISKAGVPIVCYDIPSVSPQNGGYAGYPYQINVPVTEYAQPESITVSAGGGLLASTSVATQTPYPASCHY